MAFTSKSEDEALRSRVDDTVRLCDKRGVPCFLGFLDLHEQAVARQSLAHTPPDMWRFYGGYDEAERCLLAVYPSYLPAEEEDFPLCAIGFRYRTVKALTHRDVLGTLLSAGIRRDKVGDILCGEGLSVAFLHRDIVPFVCEQIQCIGGEGVTLLPEYAGELPVSRNYRELRETVASPRLDCVAKALLHCSREEASRLIVAGLVSVDHHLQTNVSRQLSAPCTVSVRGNGRYLIDQVGPETKKGRLTLLARKCV